MEKEMEDVRTFQGFSGNQAEAVCNRGDDGRSSGVDIMAGIRS